jgi:molybdopterin converting factor subunit 1
MQVRVLFFGMLKDLAGRADHTLELPAGASLGDALQQCTRLIPGLAALSSVIAMSVNQEYSAPDTPLHGGDEIALLPPVSGGTQIPYAAIIRAKIDAQAIAANLKHPEDGALVLFEGIVRNHTRGRRSLYLDYQAYEDMALKMMERLASEALTQFQIRDVALVHRLGRLEIGETSVLIAVASAHRAPAFEACRWLIDTLKRTVPIWKKEYFEDGAVWADGEPFPDAIVGTQGSPHERPASK